MHVATKPSRWFANYGRPSLDVIAFDDAGGGLSDERPRRPRDARRVVADHPGAFVY